LKHGWAPLPSEKMHRMSRDIDMGEDTDTEEDVKTRARVVRVAELQKKEGTEERKNRSN
jgi:hypothetical protein